MGKNARKDNHMLRKVLVCVLMIVKGNVPGKDSLGISSGEWLQGADKSQM